MIIRNIIKVYVGLIQHMSIVSGICVFNFGPRVVNFTF